SCCFIERARSERGTCGDDLAPMRVASNSSSPCGASRGSPDSGADRERAGDGDASDQAAGGEGALRRTAVQSRRKELRMPRAPTRGRIAVGAVAIAGLLALVLLAMGREPWCTCGRIALWHGVVDSAENSQHLFDWYSFTHLAHGFGLYALVTRLAPGASPGVRFLLAMAGEAAWEAIENTPFVIERYRAVTLARGYYGDSVVNALGDLATA